MTLDSNIFNDVFLYSPFNNTNAPLTPVSKMLVSLDGIHSGVPTRTTATLTPTTLRNIEQTFIELSSETPSSVPCQAGFVPPLAPFPFEQDHNSLGSTGSGSNSSWHTPPPGLSEDLISSVSQGSSSDGAATSTSNSAGTSVKTTPAPRRNMGGRRPAKACNLTPEEEQKRMVRRERNKLAAARCRKRRVDHTNELTDEVNGLEKKKQDLQSDIQTLQQQKEELEFLLESHRAHCRLKGRPCSPLDVKPTVNTMLALCERIKAEPLDLDGPPSPKRVMLSSASSDVIILPPMTSTSSVLSKPMRPNRPSSLNVPLTMTPSQAMAVARGIGGVTELAGVPITTPSNGIFNFDSLMDGGTGLTPVSAPLVPNCSVQNKSPLELATPTSEPSKLVSL